MSAVVLLVMLSGRPAWLFQTDEDGKGDAALETVSASARSITTRDAGQYTNNVAEKMCNDPKKLMPLCNSCIPGLAMKSDSDSQQCQLSEPTTNIRKQLFRIAAKRGASGTCQVYKYLATETLRQRHKVVGKLLDDLAPKRVLDIGAYTNPIRSFMTHCPESVVMIEPCGELSHDGDAPYVSKEVSCAASGGNSFEHVMPTSIKTFIHDPHFQHFDAVVCIGCDKNYGPSWKELMLMPRPFHIALEFSSTMAFHEDYPSTDTMGCSVTYSQDFDFSECPDCSFDDAKQETQYGKSRKLVVFHCTDYPQEKSRAAEAEKAIAPFCDSAKNGTYRAMACTAEHLLMSKRINDTALMAVNAISAAEEEDNTMITARTMNLSRYKGTCKALGYKIARTWWDAEENPRRVKDVKGYIEKANNAATSGNILEALCWAGNARILFSAAKPQKMKLPLYESILLYQTLLQKVILDEPMDALNYRFRIKTCPPHLSREYMHEVAEMEPILPNGRNIDWREFGNLISFNPYRPLMSFPSVQSRKYRKRVLLDVGANGFAASPKQIMDNYGAFNATFDEVVMFEPDIDGMQYIPKCYKESANITFHRQYVEVASGKIENDIIAWIKNYIHKDDFLVLKFDVDEGIAGPSMEWGFLGDLLYSDALGLVDEFYTELHYRQPTRVNGFRWKHETHSSRQRYDIVRQLRACGMAIHDWP